MTRLIDADAQKRTYTQNCDYENCIYDGAFIVNNIDEQPTVDAEPVRHGKWMKCDEDKWEHIYALRCSECHGGYHLSHETTTAWNYCPECGARMDQ